jgi:rubrerythrin
MTIQNTTSDRPAGNAIERYRANYLSEQEGVYLYSKLAEIESDEHLAELYRHLAAIEQRHADLWKGLPEQGGGNQPALQAQLAHSDATVACEAAWNRGSALHDLLDGKASDERV